MVIINKYFKTYSKRTSKFLYNLGFDKTSYYDDFGKEFWIYKRNPLLNEALEFYFYFRDKQKQENHT